MSKYRKRPVVIEAVQWTALGQVHDICEWSDSFPAEADGPVLAYDGTLAGPCDPETGEDWGLFTIETLEGDLTVSPRDWIIRGVQGEFYPCKPEIFAATYEPVEE